jgi:single-strand DNA-binding protein
MRSINKVIIIGNLTRDPVVKTTQSGQPIATFGVATNREWITRDSQRHSSTEFHEVVAWAKLAEIAEKYLRKGKLVYIEGYLKTRSWDAPDGSGKRYRTEIVAQDVVMLEKRPRDMEGMDGGSDDMMMEPQASTDEPPLDELDLGDPISEEIR